MDNKEISYRKQRPDLFFRDGRPKKKAMLCEKESYQRETKLINGPGFLDGHAEATDVLCTDIAINKIYYTINR